MVFRACLFSYSYERFQSKTLLVVREFVRRDLQHDLSDCFTVGEWYEC